MGCYLSIQQTYKICMSNSELSINTLTDFSLERNRQNQPDPESLGASSASSKQELKESRPFCISTDGENSTVSNYLDQREKCKYEDKCYRRSSEHRATFSHPGDPDYDRGSQLQECRYGKYCYRKNLKHRAKFKHTTEPSRYEPTRSKQRGSRTGHSFEEADELSDQESAEESIDESEYEPSSESEDSSDGVNSMEDSHVQCKD